MFQPTWGTILWPDFPTAQIIVKSYPVQEDMIQLDVLEWFTP